MKDLSLEEFNKIYDLLNIKFDSLNHEVHCMNLDKTKTFHKLEL